MRNASHIVFIWLMGAAVVTVCSVMVYVGLQQNYRAALNDPQVEIVSDAQLALQSGGAPAQVIPRLPSSGTATQAAMPDASKSLAPFIVVLDKEGRAIESNATVGGALITVPIEVLEKARANGENRVTWQPDEKTDIALVVRPISETSEWYIASGRNTREVESRINALGVLILLTWLAGVVALGLLAYFFRPASSEKSGSSIDDL